MCYEECCHIGCGDCKYFQVDADRRQDVTCRRIDHKRVKFAVPWFKSYDCGQQSGIICADFVPAKWHKWLFEHWTSIEDYCREYEEVEGRPRVRGMLWLCLDGNTDVEYGVDYLDFYNGTFAGPDGKPMWKERRYYKRSRKSPIGYELVYEYPEQQTS